MDVLGSLSFTSTPDVNTDLVLTSEAGVTSFSAGSTAARPPAGIAGSIYLDTDVNRLFYDDGASWVDTTQVPLINGTADQINVVQGTNTTPTVISIAANPTIPGTGAMRIPRGTSAQRPALSEVGDIRFNTTTNLTEEYNGTAWSPAGRVLQVVSGTIAVTTGSTQLPWDNTSPLITEGIQIWQTSFTPLLATSRIIVEFTVTTATSTANRVATSTAFYGTTLMGGTGSFMAASNQPYNTAVKFVFSPGSTATVTVQGRCGLNGSGTLSINQVNGNSLAGNAATQYTITEIA